MLLMHFGIVNKTSETASVQHTEVRYLSECWYTRIPSPQRSHYNFAICTFRWTTTLLASAWPYRTGRSSRVRTPSLSWATGWPCRWIRWTRHVLSPSFTSRPSLGGKVSSPTAPFAPICCLWSACWLVVFYLTCFIRFILFARNSVCLRFKSLFFDYW